MSGSWFRAVYFTSVLYYSRRRALITASHRAVKGDVNTRGFLRFRLRSAQQSEWRE